MQEFDTIVVGLGAMGIAATYQLAKSGNRVLGIDRFSPPHNRGSSHGDTRITRFANGEGPHYTASARRSHEIWREIERETGKDLLTITGGLIISGGTTTAQLHVEGFYGNTVNTAKTLGIEHEILDAKAIRARFPQFRVETGEEGYFEPGAGFLRVDACVAGQLELAQKFGAEIHTGEKVIGIHSGSNGVTVETDRTTHHGRSALLCVGAWAPEFVAKNYARNFRVFRQSLHWFDIAQTHGSFAPGKFPIFIWEMLKTGKAIYGFPAADGASGGIKIATETYETPITADSADPGADDGDAMHRELIAEHIPEVGARCLRSETCFYTVTPDAGFVIDTLPGTSNVMFVSACSGHGFKHSAAIGEALSQLLVDGRSRLDLSRYRFDRFRP